MLRTFFDFRRASTLIALLLIFALAAIMFASALAATQTAPADATATPTATGTATATATADPNATATPTATATATADPNATATPTATPTATVDPNATATPTATATGTATATPTTTPTATPTVPPLNADYDTDNDGLIEIRTLPQLNAIRYDLDGDGLQGSVSASDWATYTTAFLNAASDMGCQLTDHDSDSSTPQQATCTGYELMMDLNFDTDGDGDVDASDTNSYPNWTPIGTDVDPFNATFKGSLINGVMPKISNLTINSTSGRVGLFGETGANAHIESVGIVNANLSVTSSSQADIGALVGANAGKVIACYSTGAITATAGAGSYAGGLIGYQTTTASTAASFSRATVSMTMDPAVTDTSLMYIYAGGLAGHNSGTITAAYAAGAVKGKGGSSSYVGGLVGDNNGTITASYSIAPVTAAGMTPTATAPNKPGVGGLVGYNDRTNGRITASYWDYISSGVPDDDDTVAPEGKSTHTLKTPTSATGIYADWDDLTIDSDGTNDDDPWEFRSATASPIARRYPLLTYGGQTIETSGNQRFGFINIRWRYGGYDVPPREGMTLFTDRSPFNRPRVGPWLWETSVDGIDWTTHVPPTGKTSASVRGSYPTYQFVLRPEHVDKYVRAKLLMAAGDYIYTRVIAKVKAAITTSSVALSFASGHNPPRIGTATTIAPLPNSPSSRPVVGLWYSCDANDANPPSTGCELVGSNTSYTPGAADVGRYLYAYIYYKDTGVWERASPGFTPQQVADFQRRPWRAHND